VEMEMGEGQLGVPSDLHVCSSGEYHRGQGPRRVREIRVSPGS
jgi:hypothetical protein